MLSRQTHAMLELVGAVGSLIVLVFLRHEAQRYRHIDRDARLEAITKRRTDDSHSKMAEKHTAGASTEDLKAVFGAGLAEAGMAAPLKPRWLLVGVAEAIFWRLGYDYDVCRIRQSRRRRFVAEGLRYPVRRLCRRWNATWSHGFGVCVGTILYRLKYGVLDDPPRA